jgi:hypothetical protein
MFREEHMVMDALTTTKHLPKDAQKEIFDALLKLVEATQ